MRVANIVELALLLLSIAMALVCAPKARWAIRRMGQNRDARNPAPVGLVLTSPGLVFFFWFGGGGDDLSGTHQAWTLANPLDRK